MSITQIFLSHTKHDKTLCDQIDMVAPRAGVKLFRSEYESIPTPPWQTILSEIKNSKAVFVLVGKRLADLQREGGSAWVHTQNWIAFEIGAATAAKKDVWAIVENGAEFNFPMPYINHLMIVDFTFSNAQRNPLASVMKSAIASRSFHGGLSSQDYLKMIFEAYIADENYVSPEGMTLEGYNTLIECNKASCRLRFNLHNTMSKMSYQTWPCCPHCLTRLPPMLLVRDKKGLPPPK